MLDVATDTDEAVVEVTAKIKHLKKVLDADVPGMSNLLRDIHRQLHSQPEVVTLLEPEDIHTLVSGLDKQTGLHMATIKKAKPKRAKKKVDVGDGTVSGFM